MRSRLLLSVAHLPTIRETSEEVLPGGHGREPPASPSLDDYVRSICQLAQPTSGLEEAAARVQPGRPHWLAGACQKNSTKDSLQDITSRFSGQRPTLSSAGTADPLDWLFGESQGKLSSRMDPLRRTAPPADSWGSRRQMDSSKSLYSSKSRGAPKGRLCDARVPGHSLVRLSRDWHQRTRASAQPGWAAASPTSSHPNSVLRTLYLHLPVIHEL